MSERGKQNCCSRFLDRFDIFSYIPVPQSFPVSTRKSKIGSVVVICLFIGYLIYDFVKFLSSNKFSVNTYSGSLPTQVHFK
jgi:hypothetical protein